MKIRFYKKAYNFSQICSLFHDTYKIKRNRDGHKLFVKHKLSIYVEIKRI